MVEPNPDTWQEALTRRLRTLLRTAPLHRIEAAKGYREGELSGQDLRALSLRALDLTIERMGLGTGIAHDELREGLTPLVQLSDPGTSGPEADAVADTVIAALLNEGQRRQAFTEPYLALSEHSATRKALSFHLLRERESPDGGTVIVATTEGINLYAGMLEYPVEDAQVAEEAVLQSQVRRGRIADAVRTAQRARLRSIEYEQKILGVLETTRRDIQQVDWVQVMLGTIGAAREHIEERLRAEREIQRAVDTHLDAATGDNTRELTRLGDTLAECVTRHLRLHEALIKANQEYLQEQERQAFRPRLAQPLPDLEADVLRTALGAPTSSLARAVDLFISRLQAPNPPVALRLVQLVDRLLAPRRDTSGPTLDTGEADLELLPPPPPHFEEADHAAVEALLAGLHAKTRLSELLARARDAGLRSEAVHLLTLRLLSAFDPDQALAVRVEPAGVPLRDPEFIGDDLYVCPAEAEPA
ncbi:MAG: hypothetical protein OXU20_30720 [Myxococcales bacterium]|nr:hypothetical protein [Myxococcales bacterium]